MARNSLILVLLFGGTAGVLVSFVLPAMLSPENTWSSSSAEDLQKTQLKIQQLVTRMDKATSGDEKKRIEADLKKEQETLAGHQGGFAGSTSLPYWTSILVMVLGIGMTVGGFCLYYFVPMPVEKKLTLAELDPDGTLAEKELTALDYRNAVRQSRGKHKSHH